MSFKDIIKGVLSYIVNPISLMRMEKVGKCVDVRRGLRVNGPNNIQLGDFVRIDRMSRLSSYEGGKIIIEDGCYIGQFFSVMAGGDVLIKKNTLIASYVAVVGENHGMDPEIGVRYGNQPLIKRGVEIGENCWIGEKVVVLSGVTIGDWCIIGACSVVNKSIPPYSIVVGNPAKVIKKYDFDSKQWIRV
jgi:lipopolysaccharide O-acetyltransferase